MFRALGRWIRAVGYLLTGQIDAARRTLDLDPHVMRAKYDEILRDKTSHIQQYKQAVAGLIAQQENKMQKVKTLTGQVERLENLKAGAVAKAKQTVRELQRQGHSGEQIQANANYLRCQAAYKDFSSTLAEKLGRIEELEADISEYGARINDHKVQLQSLLQELDQVRTERADAVADVITARQEKELADTLAGIAQEGTAEELQRMRQLRREIKAEARISRELAGTDTKMQEAEFLEFARWSESDPEFNALTGLESPREPRPALEELEDGRPALPE